MRKVLIKKWIKGVKESNELTFKYQEGTNCYDKDFSIEGTFLAWGVAYEECQTGVGNFTVAIIELEDGTVVDVLISNMKFDCNV